MWSASRGAGRLSQRARALLLVNALVVGACTRDNRLAVGRGRDAPADFCRLAQNDTAVVGLTLASPFVNASPTTVTHRQPHLTARSTQAGDSSNGEHAIVVMTAPGAAGVEALRFFEADPGSGASHRVAIADDGRRIYLFGQGSSQRPFIQAEGTLRLRIVPEDRALYRLRACPEAAKAVAQA
jgi:hypothetical protein